MFTRPPQHPALRGVVELLWVSQPRPISARELVIPTGQLHLAWRACGAPIRLGVAGEQVERAGVLGGARLEAHVHDTPHNTRSVGVMLCPGAAPRLFGETARALAGRHTGLEALWGADASRLQARLCEAESDDVALALVEEALLARIRFAARPPGLREALAAIDGGASVGAAASLIGRSPRTLGVWFDEAIGLSPVAWARLRRLQRALRLADAEPDWSTVAARAGFADHAHLCREVRAIVGVTPTSWRAGRHGGPNHLPISASDSFKPHAPTGGTDDKTPR